MSTKDPLQQSPPLLEMDNDLFRRRMEESLQKQIANSMERTGLGVEFNDVLLSSQWKPEVDVSVDQESLIIRVDLPGIDPQNLAVTLEGKKVIISGERRVAQARESESYHLQERRYGKFNRSIMLPSNLDLKGISAKYKNGVLHLTIPKLGEITEPYRAVPEQESAMDPNYQAYLREKPELEETLAGHMVAYADGRRIAEGRDAQELTENIPAEYRQRSLFIKDVSERPIRFRRPFFIHQ